MRRQWKAPFTAHHWRRWCSRRASFGKRPFGRLWRARGRASARPADAGRSMAGGVEALLGRVAMHVKRLSRLIGDDVRNYYNWIAVISRRGFRAPNCASWLRIAVKISDTFFDMFSLIQNSQFP